MRSDHYIYEVSLDEFIRTSSFNEIFDNELVIIEVKGENAKELRDHPPFHLNAFSILLASQGEFSLKIDYLSYRLKANMGLQIINYHVWEGIHWTPDFRGYHIVISHDLLSLTIKESNEKSQKLVQGQIPPLVEYEEKEMRRLLNIIERMSGYIAEKDHLFREILVKNELSTFLYEMMNINLKKNIPNVSDGPLNLRDEILGKFIELLVIHCRKEHEVSFYATKLCITPTYLSRTIKCFSGKTANKWISNAIIAEAKMLLRKPDSSVQEVADELYFSDQSAFGKFFKKHTGKSPLEYKKNRSS